MKKPYYIRELTLNFMSDKKNGVSALAAAAELFIANVIYNGTPPHPGLPRATFDELLDDMDEMFKKYDSLCEECETAISEFYKNRDVKQLTFRLSNVTNALRDDL